MVRQRAVWIAMFGLGLVLSGCAASGWFAASDAPSTDRPKARYSAAAGVALHRAPDASSEVVGTLALHEGVLRYQQDGEFAYVTSDKTGRSGWVRERELIERLPAPKKTAAAPAPAPAAAEPSETVEPAEAEEPTEPAPPPAPREKSVFDPY